MRSSSRRIRKTRPYRAGIILLVALLPLSACAPVTPYWDARFGDSVRFAVAQQTIDPDASANTDPVSGIDGRPANDAARRYFKSFQEPPPPAPLFQILNLGGTGQ